MKILKQVMGVDVSQQALDVCLGHLREDLTTELYKHRVFPNKAQGHIALEQWLRNHTDATVPVRIVLEATGVYHQLFASYMDSEGYAISIVLPTKISNYIRTLEVKTVTDKTCCQALARFGLERKLDNWKKPDPAYEKLRQLTREREQIVQERTMVKNRLHAEQSEACPNANSIKRIEERIGLLNQQEEQIRREIRQIITSEASIQQGVERICTIPGIGTLTAVILLAETNGFELVRNKKQIASYAGLDVREKRSGTSVHGKPRISKRGNKYIRKALYLPSLAAARYNPAYKELYTRLVSRHGIKMKALVAVQRKMLELAYILHKNQTDFNAQYEQEKRAVENVLSSQTGS